VGTLASVRESSESHCKSGNGFGGLEVVFATGFDHPIDVAEDHMGDLLVADYGGRTIYRISYQPGQPAGTSTIQGNPSTLESLIPEILLLGIIVLGVVLFILRRPRPRI